MQASNAGARVYGTVNVYQEICIFPEKKSDNMHIS